MQKQNHSFVYFLAWLIIGTFLGAVILLVRGDISLSLNQANISDSSAPAAVYATGRDDGFSDAVMKAAPAVVSIQSITWATDSTPISTDEELIGVESVAQVID